MEEKRTEYVLAEKRHERRVRSRHEGLGHKKQRKEREPEETRGTKEETRGTKEEEEVDVGHT